MMRAGQPGFDSHRSNEWIFFSWPRRTDRLCGPYSLHCNGCGGSYHAHLSL